MRGRKQWMAYLMAAALTLTATACAAQPPQDPQSPVKPLAEDPVQTEMKKMLRVDGRLYYSTDRASDFTPTCGTMDGTVETTVERTEIPTENGQSNFGAGYGYQIVSENALEVWIEEERIRFECAKADASFAENVDRFAVQTAAELLSGQENYCYSPVSLYYALSMAATGAAGETQRQMYDLLGAENTAQLAQDCGTLLDTLHRDGEYSKLYLANSVWMRKDIAAKEAYRKGLGEHFSAELFQVDFNQKTDRDMTKWVRQQTKGLLAPEFQHDADTMEVLLNTIYYKDTWADTFAESATEQAVFTDAKGGTHEADFMHTESIGQVEQGEHYTKAALPFMSGSEMVFILPKEEISLARLLSEEGLQTLLHENSAVNCRIAWAVPKFKQEFQLDLIPMLKGLGICDAFTAAADFSAASDSPSSIGAVEQGTAFSIDENGVEAAAYTEIAKDEAAAIADVDQIVDMNLNRPFLYALRNADGTLLFVGVCEQPGA